MKFKLQPYQIHELGQRQNQEDSMFPSYGKSTTDDRLFILCDGMGGHEKGEVASATVCEAMSQTILSRWDPDEPLSDDLLLQAIEEAYDALDTIQTNQTPPLGGGRERSMGTTMTFLCFHSEGATVAHIGDSRIYQIRPSHPSFGGDGGGIIFKTSDHSLVNDLIKIGEITEEEAKNHPQKNVITRAMQPCQERRSKADIAHLTDIQAGDYFYMCSDGMLEQTSDENLLYIITKPKTKDGQKVEMLIDVTKDNKDNHTAHLIYINKVEGAPSVAPIAPITQSEEITSISSNDENSQRPQGTWITPEEEPTKKSKLPIIIIAIILLAAIAGGLYYFFSSSPEQEETEEVDNPPVELIDSTPITGKDKVENPKKTPQQEEGSEADGESQNTPAIEEHAEEQTQTTPPAEENKKPKKEPTKISHKEQIDLSEFTPKKSNIKEEPNTNNLK